MNTTLELARQAFLAMMAKDYRAFNVVEAQPRIDGERIFLSAGTQHMWNGFQKGRDLVAKSLEGDLAVEKGRVEILVKHMRELKLAQQAKQVGVPEECWACNDTGVVTTSSNGSGLIEAPCQRCADAPNPPEVQPETQYGTIICPSVKQIERRKPVLKNTLVHL